MPLVSASNCVIFSDPLNSLYITFGDPSPSKLLKKSDQEKNGADNIRNYKSKIRLCEDLAPEVLRVMLSNEFRQRLFEIACQSAGSMAALARLMEVPQSTILKYRNGNRTIPYLFLQRLSVFLRDQSNCKYQNEIKKHVSGFKLGTKGNSAVTIKIKEGTEELDFENADGARIIAAILGDGYLGDNVASYINPDTTLQTKVNESIQKVVGNIPVNKIYRGKEVRYPQALAMILKKVGLPLGPKVYTNPSVPSWIKKSNDINIPRIFLRQFFSDESDANEKKGMINLPQSIDITTLPSDIKKKLKAGKLDEENYERYAPLRLLDVGWMLWTRFGIRTNGPYPVKYYKAVRKGLEGERLKWVLSISGKVDLDKFEREIGFDIEYKQNALRNYISRIKIYQAKSGFGFLGALKAAGKVESVQGEITSSAIAKEMKHCTGASQKWLRRLVERELIVKIGGGESKGRALGRAPVRYKLTDKGLSLSQNFATYQNLDIRSWKNKKEIFLCQQNS